MPLKTIWKFPFIAAAGEKLVIPERHKVLHVGLDPSGAMCLWAEVDPDSAMCQFEYVVKGTGHRLVGTEGMEFIGTVLQAPFVWHVYARGLTK